MTKKHSSTWAASDSPPRNTITGHSQLPKSSTPRTAATNHWLSLTGAEADWRMPATISVPTPPAMEAATIARAGRGSFMVRLRRDHPLVPFR